MVVYVADDQAPAGRRSDEHFRFCSHSGTCKENRLMTASRHFLRIIFTGEAPVRSSPLLTWSSVLEKIGADTRFVNPCQLGTGAWLKELRQCDYIIVQQYRGISSFLIKRLALATLLGIPVIRKWSGTDVLLCIEDVNTLGQSVRLNNVCAKNISDTHQGIIDELRSIGITCSLAAVPLQLDWNTPLPLTRPPNGVLAYLPADRWSFYGGEWVRKAIVENPDLQFHIVADDSHQLKDYPNVHSHGWTDDMEDIWAQCGSLLRITEHDGLSRMIVEALNRGLYVIHNLDIPGVWQVVTTAEMQKKLELSKLQSGPNLQGRSSMREFLGTDPDQRLMNLIRDAHVTPMKRLAALIQFLKLQLQDTLSGIIRR